MKEEEKQNLIVPITEWGVSQGMYEPIMIQPVLEYMNQTLQTLPADTFIPIQTEPIVFSTNPKAQLLVEDTDRVAPSIASAELLHDNFLFSSNDSLSQAVPWKLCDANQARHLIKCMKWDHVGKRFKKAIHAWRPQHIVFVKFFDRLQAADNVDGITLQGKNEYMIINGCSQRIFGDGWGYIVADLYISAVPAGKTSLEYIFDKGLLPSYGKDKKFWDILGWLYANDLVRIQVTADNRYALQYQLKKFNWDSLPADIQAYFQEAQPASFMEKKLKDLCWQPILQRDRIRIDMTPYSPQVLTDPNCGVWELWERTLSQENMHMVPLTEEVYARDPRQDISQSGVIGIDFGTKSTVVVCLGSTNQPVPLRIGTGQLDRKEQPADNENPTVIQFSDIQSFLQEYHEKEGRPFTKWEDVCISHTAYNRWMENEDSDECAAFFGTLKQWAGTQGKRIRIRDMKGHELSLPPYDKLQEEDVDPIEIYAYYIGLYINNMHKRQIYLRYLLSFPVTYPKQVREHILQSFQRGIAHSLPETILQDTECMKLFSVSQGVGEPAAYAACALQELQLTPELGQSLFYGVFDFGGGTTDFDFGIYRRADNSRKERRYRYVIQHFGAGGDRYLGGENLLELLSYHVFKDNADALRSDHIPFVRPPEQIPFPGDEIIVNDSQEAETNTRRMMKLLRPFWERETEDIPPIGDGSGIVKVSLFDSQGDVKPNCELQVDAEKLDAILRERIQRGVKSFFDALITLLKNETYAELQNIQTVHVLLAGNSSKSPILLRIFDEAINKYTEQFNAVREKNGMEPFQQVIIQLHKPLGSDETADVPQDEAYHPNGKTGVAVGLVQCRPGSKIKVITDQDTSKGKEIKFQYWIGDEDENGCLEWIIHPDSSYETWVEYLDAGIAENEFNYTTRPEAELGKLPIQDTLRKAMMIPKEAVNEEFGIYLRPKAPRVLEYVVAESLEKANAGEYICNPMEITLE